MSTLSDLKKLCKEHGLKSTGTKQQLSERYELFLKKKVAMPKRTLILQSTMKNYQVDPNTLFVWEGDVIVGKQQEERLVSLSKTDLLWLNGNPLFHNFKKKIPDILEGKALRRRRKDTVDTGSDDEEEEN